MSQNTEFALKQAFSLIEAGNLEDAKAILRPILESDKDNADVWWLYSHAVTDTDTARLALNNVLRIEPHYPDARDLLNQLEVNQSSEQFDDDILDIDKDPEFIPAMPSSIPGIKPILPGSKVSDIDDLPDDIFDDGEDEEAFYRRPLFYMPLLTILLVAALVIVIFKPFAVSSPLPQTTEVPTQIPIETIQSSAMEITPTLEEINSGISTSTPEEFSDGNATATPFESTTSESGVFSAIVKDFTGYNLPAENPVAISDTNLGKTLRVSICTTAGKELRELLPKAMETLAKASTNYPNQAQAISAQMLDCSSNTTLLWLGSSIDDAVAFANTVLSDKEYQAKWKPVIGS